MAQRKKRNEPHRGERLGGTTAGEYSRGLSEGSRSSRCSSSEPHRGERLPETGDGHSGRRGSRPDYIRHDLRCTELSQREIARKYGVDTRTVYFHAQLILRRGDRPEKVFRMRERKITEAERTEIERIIKQGGTFLAAAYEVQVSIRTVLKVVYGEDYFQKWEESDE